MNKNVLIRLILASMSIALLVLLAFSYMKTKETENVRHKFDTSVVPEIKEDFKNTELKFIRSYDNKINYNEEDNELTIFDNDIKQNIIIGKFGTIYTNPIIPNTDKDGNYGITLGNYLVVYDDDGRFSYTNIKNGNKSSYYKSTDEYYNQLMYMMNNKTTSEYLVLPNNDNITLFNYNNGKTISLNSKIKQVKILSNDGVSQYENNYINYIIAKDDNGKYGLIDYSGNTKLEFKYDRLENYINKDEYIACLNNKCGLIDSSDKVLLNLEYDDIIYNNEYKILLRNNTAAVMYSDKLVVNFVIPFNGTKDSSFDLIYNNGLLLLISKANYEDNTQLLWDNSKSYLIGNKGLIKRFDGYLKPVYDYKSKKLLYLFNIYKGNLRYGITFYDTDLYEYYATNVKFDVNYDYQVNITKMYKDKNYFKVTLDDNNKHINNYYVDLYNSKMIKEKVAYYTYFKNGYAFTLVNGKLTIYKKDEVIDEYEGIDTYLGNYYFSKQNNNKYDVLELIFNKNDSEN